MGPLKWYLLSLAGRLPVTGEGSSMLLLGASRPFLLPFSQKTPIGLNLSVSGLHPSPRPCGTHTCPPHSVEESELTVTLSTVSSSPVVFLVASVSTSLPLPALEPPSGYILNLKTSLLCHDLGPDHHQITSPSFCPWPLHSVFLVAAGVSTGEKTDHVMPLLTALL